MKASQGARASLPCEWAHERGHACRSAISGRTSTGTASTRRRCGALAFSVGSARSRPSSYGVRAARRLDGDHTRAARKGMNPLERGSQVHFMGEFQNLLDFPPALKTEYPSDGSTAEGSQPERRGEALFLGKAQCSIRPCAAEYTDTDDNLGRALLQKERVINGRKASADGLIQDVPTARSHRRSSTDEFQGRRLTSGFFLALGLSSCPRQKKDLVALPASAETSWTDVSANSGCARR